MLRKAEGKAYKGMVANTVGNTVAVSQRNKHRIPMQSSHYPCGYIPKRIESGPQREICTAVLIALFTVAKRQKQAKYPLMDEWISKMSSRHTMSYYSSFRRKEIMTHAAT